MDKALQVIASRYSEDQLNKTHEIITDLQHEAMRFTGEKGFMENHKALGVVGTLLEKAINLDA